MKLKITQLCIPALLLCLSTTNQLRAKQPLVYPDWKSKVPEPVFEDNTDYVDLYWAAWQLAAEHVHTGKDMPQSPYMDESFWGGVIWIWDTCLMGQFTKYSPQDFPGVESLNNFYGPMLKGQSSSQMIEHPDNPPLMAWTEHSNWEFNGTTSQGSGREATEKTLGLLVEFYHLFNDMPLDMRFKRDKVHLRRVEDEAGQLKGFYWTGNASGMDNTTRGRGIGYNQELKVRPMLWFDALAQQALAAQYIVEMAAAIGDEETEATFKKEYAQLKDTINRLYWDEQDGCYYDRTSVEQPGKDPFSRVLTPASFWPLLAGVASEEQAAKMAAVVADPQKLGGPVPFPSLSRGDPNFKDDGQYWQGAVWMPLSYMSIKALEKYGYDELADSAAKATVEWMLKTYQNPELLEHNDGKPTIWECYNPVEPVPGTHGPKYSRPDFCGWSALGPISLFIENVLGFHEVNFRTKTVGWRLHHPGRQGLKNLRFGNIETTILYDGKGTINVTSNQPYTLVVNGTKHSVSEGESVLPDIQPLEPVSFKELNEASAEAGPSNAQ